jgi:hypothetical protein
MKLAQERNAFAQQGSATNFFASRASIEYAGLDAARHQSLDRLFGERAHQEVYLDGAKT